MQSLLRALDAIELPRHTLSVTVFCFLSFRHQLLREKKHPQPEHEQWLKLSQHGPSSGRFQRPSHMVKTDASRKMGGWLGSVGTFEYIRCLLIMQPSLKMPQNPTPWCPLK